MTAPHVDDLVAAYAFGALTSVERDRVRLHLASCVSCADLVSTAEGVTEAA